MNQTFNVACGKNNFKVKVGEEFVPIKDLNEFSLSIDGTTEDWYPQDLQGKRKVMKTAVAYSASCSCKRCFGDPGQESIYKTTFEIENECLREFQITWADGEVLEFEGVVNVSSLGGSNTEVMALEFEVLINGDITITPATGE